MSIWRSPGLLLLVTGGLLGLTFPFGKLATAAGVSPYVWSFAISGGAGAVLLIAVLATGLETLRFDAPRLRYFAITALLSYAIPNVLVFSSIPRLGAGFTSIMFTLSPVLTLALSITMRLRSPNLLGVAGIGVGFLGAILVTVTRGEVGRPADPLWIALALLIPVSLAIGNIYRTIDWPKDASPIELAIGSNLAAAVILAPAALLIAGEFPIAQLARVPTTAIAQIVVTAAMVALFFRLQVVGGPVYLSQIGYVAAAVGLGAGTLFMGESYAALTWIGAAIIAIGIVMTTLAQRSRS